MFRQVNSQIVGQGYDDDFKSLGWLSFGLPARVNRRALPNQEDDPRDMPLQVFERRNL